MSGGSSGSSSSAVSVQVAAPAEVSRSVIVYLRVLLSAIVVCRPASLAWKERTCARWIFLAVAAEASQSMLTALAWRSRIGCRTRLKCTACRTASCSPSSAGRATRLDSSTTRKSCVSHRRMAVTSSLPTKTTTVFRFVSESLQHVCFVSTLISMTLASASVL